MSKHLTDNLQNYVLFQTFNKQVVFMLSSILFFVIFYFRITQIFMKFFGTQSKIRVKANAQIRLR